MLPLRNVQLLIMQESVDIVNMMQWLLAYPRFEPSEICKYLMVYGR